MIKPKKSTKKQQNPFLQYCKDISKKTNNYQYVLDYLSTNYELVTVDMESNDFILNKPLIEQKVSSLDEQFISFLLSDSRITELFFKSIGKLTVFNQQQFLELVFNTNEYMSQSHTRYKNKIGLASEHGSVVLNFPFKDCTLVGGMTIAEQGAKIEVFYNKVLDKNYIDKLFQPKLLTKAVKLAIENKTVVESIPTGVGAQDHLVIKGNNLIALHTLKIQFREQVDVIYLDPPYYFEQIKSSDTFLYNSNFKLSSWLTFMRNRLEVALILLKDTGVVYLSIDEDGMPYLKLLCKEIFGAQNEVCTFIWKKKSTYGRGHRYCIPQTEYILVFAKNKLMLDNSDFVFQGNPISKAKKSVEQKYPHVDAKGRYYLATLEHSSPKGPYVRKTLQYPVVYKGEQVHCNTGQWLWEQNRVAKELEASPDVSDLVIERDSNNKLRLFKKIRFKSDKITPTSLIADAAATTTSATKDLAKLFPNINAISDNDEEIETENIFSFSKPVSLIKFLISCIPVENAVVLDFFGGSGTTGHAVLELNKEDGGNRRFIMVEQLDYAQTLTLERVKRAAVKYDYTANIVYAELKQSIVKQEILNSTTIDEIISVIENNFELGYFQNIENKDILIELIKAESDVEIVKKGLIEHIFDHNQEYYSTGDFAEAMLNEAEVKLNNNFFGLE